MSCLSFNKRIFAVTAGAFGLLTLIAYSFLPAAADADIRHAECFQFKKEVPYGDDHNRESEVWCYRSENDGTRIVYQPSTDGSVRPELTLAILPNGTLKHASLNAGKLTVHSLERDENWNPLGVPLEPPTGEEAVRVPEPVSVLSADHPESYEAALRLVGGQPTNEETDLPYKAKVEEGRYTVKAEYLPWRSFWFPQGSGRLHNGANSPMAKYDHFVGRRIGASPRAQQLEKQMHPPRLVKWAGHCNGWSASSIMRPEPTKPVTDPFTGVTFTVADQKGLWLEVDYCPKSVFFGRRNYGGGHDGDVRAVDFHNVISYYIGELKKPIIMDLMSNSPVENRVVSGYDMKVSQVREGLYNVATTLTIHSYDGHPNEKVGPAGIFTRTYHYLLEVDEEGRAVSAKWLSSHPDFFWVPLAPGECESKNPVVQEAWMKELYRISQRPVDRPIKPSLGLLPGAPASIAEDTRPLGAAVETQATPAPAERQPDEGN